MLGHPVIWISGKTNDGRLRGLGLRGFRVLGFGVLGVGF